jgi:FAD/FMN-containing dehydrogenase/Fe-S oxidoreductase
MAEPLSTAPREGVAVFERALRAQLRGEVSFDLTTRGIHATDASHYQIMPSCVVWPRDRGDAATAVRLAAAHGVSITPRGGATSLSGQTTWHGMVLDCSQHMDRILEVNADEQWARVQPGVIRDQLNAAVADDRLHFAPDPATSNRCTIAGMIGNNSSGTHSIAHGKTIDHVIEVTVALTDGTVLTLGPCDDGQWQAKTRAPGREGQIYRGFQRIIEANRDEIAARFPRVMRRVSGYNLDAFLHERTDQPWNLASLIVGSEGTLGFVLEAKVKLTPLPEATALCLVHFDSMDAAMRAVQPILAHQAAAVELLDRQIVTEAQKNSSTAAAAADCFEGAPEAVLIVEMFADSAEAARQKIDALAQQLKAAGHGYAWVIKDTPSAQQRVWFVRKMGNGLASNVKGPRKRQPFIEDACVPVEHLPEYMQRVTKLCESMKTPVSLYGHASVGVIHIEPMLDLHQPAEVEKMRTIAERVFAWVRAYGGAWSGEHGDGLVRGEFLPRFFGEQIYEAFAQVKGLFDPHGLMNPGKVIDPPAMTEHLRYGAGYQVGEITTSYHYREQGGFALAVEQCNGMGACRKLEGGTMCPSYMATRDEAHSTRGRANALRLAMTNQLGPEAMTGQRLHEVLDLCLECKACKSECPNGVDMARLKSDVLHMQHQHHGTPIAARLFGAVAGGAKRVAGPGAPVFNVMQNLAPMRWLLARVAGIDRRRSLPRITSQPLPKWFAKRQSAVADANERPRVVLFGDTFSNYFEPGVGRAAVELLESCGYAVQLAQAGCCQRPRLSKGLLDAAKRDGAATLRALEPYATAGLPIVVLEPSCASALVEDLPDLIDDEALGRRLASSVQTIDTFLAERWHAGELSGDLSSRFDRFVVHPHCHHTALFDPGAMTALLKSTGAEVIELDAGCCGMAGSFGYDHYDLSMKIGEDRLFPAVRQYQRDPNTAIIATGTSCRHQLADACGLTARHWVELVRGAQAR